MENVLNRFEEAVEHGFLDSNGVRIHYAALGDGPLVLMVHGFPDFWYTWRRQMEALAPSFRCVAIDTRGYNLSDRPKGIDEYKLEKLSADVVAAIRHFGGKAILCGHDWGGATSWRTALTAPQHIEKLIILNLPHPQGMSRELANNPAQQAASEYARVFQQEGAHLKMTAEKLADWVTDADARPKYVEAFNRSDFEAMLNYYKASYMRPPYKELPPLPKVKMPVLQIHGLKDHALLPGALNDTWLWMEQDYTLVTIPHSGHFVQQDAADLVSKTMRMWLGRDE